MPDIGGLPSDIPPGNPPLNLNWRGVWVASLLDFHPSLGTKDQYTAGRSRGKAVGSAE